MGSLCSKHDKNENEPPLPPVRVVSVADVAARTAVLLERRATLRAAGAATYPATIPEVVLVDPPPTDPPPVVAPEPPPQPPVETLRLSRFEVDAISDALKAGRADFVDVSKSLAPLNVILDAPEVDRGTSPRATNRGSDGEVSRSPVSSRTGTGFGTRLENWKSSEVKPGGLSGGSSSPSPSPLPGLDHQAMPPSSSRPHHNDHELQEILNSEQVKSVSSSPLHQVPDEKTRHGSSPSSKAGFKHEQKDTEAPKAPNFGQSRAAPAAGLGNVRPAQAEDEKVRRSASNSEVLAGHKDSVFSVAFTADGGRLVSGSTDKTIRIWNLSTSNLEKTIGLHIDTVRSVTVSTGNDMLASGSLDGTVRLWDLAAPTAPSKTFLARAKVMSVAFSLDGRYLVSGAQDNLVRVWDMTTGDLTLELPGHDDAVASVAVSPDNRCMASGSLDMTIRIWDFKGKLIETLDDHVGCVHAVAFSPCSSRLASGSSDKTVVLWDTTPDVQIKELHSLRQHTDFVWSVAFTREGDRVASGSADKTIIIWQVSTGLKLHVLHGHEDAVFSVAFSPCAYRIASASRDKTLRIWDVGEDLDPVHGKPVST